MLTVDGTHQDFGQGDVLVFSGPTEHLFRDLNADMRAVVVFPRRLAHAIDSDFRRFDPADLRADADPDGNV